METLSGKYSEKCKTTLYLYPITEIVDVVYDYLRIFKEASNAAFYC